VNTQTEKLKSDLERQLTEASEMDTIEPMRPELLEKIGGGADVWANVTWKRALF